MSRVAASWWSESRNVELFVRIRVAGFGERIRRGSEPDQPSAMESCQCSATQNTSLTAASNIQERRLRPAPWPFAKILESPSRLIIADVGIIKRQGKAMDPRFHARHIEVKAIVLFDSHQCLLRGIW